MSRSKELLHICIMLMLIVASRPSYIEKLREQMIKLQFILCNLEMAEKDYISYTFGKRPPFVYDLNSLDSVPGITLPVGNDTSEIQASACAISDYLDNHLPLIIGAIISYKGEELINNITEFNSQFQAAVDQTFLSENQDGDPPRCERKVSFSHVYAERRRGLRIFYACRKWLENLIATKVHCDF